MTHLVLHRGRGGGYYGGGGYYPRHSSFIWFDPSDLLWFRSRRPPRYEHAPDQPMSFLESVFSFVFGDGDPNQDYDERRWQMVRSFCLLFIIATRRLAHWHYKMLGTTCTPRKLMHSEGVIHLICKCRTSSCHMLSKSGIPYVP